MYKQLLAGLVGLVLFTLIMAACSIKDTGGAPAGPTVNMTSSLFAVTTKKVGKGETLTMINPSSQPHTIANGTWDGSTPKPAKEPNAPPVSNVNVQPGSSITVGPFNTAGSYKFYCTIHPGMMLTVIVS
jgi:plastocyanin